jgi:pimeloyl-ACP methyl ester carboxylesterase
VIRRHEVRLDVSEAGLVGVAQLGARIVYDDAVLAAAATDPPVLFCFPGGGMTLAYFDLQVAEASTPADRDTYSCAAYLAARGCVAVCVDHPGVGASDRPADGWDLSPQAVAATEVIAVGVVLSMLRAGREVPGLAALAPSVVVGVGHSMGAMIVVQQLAAGAPYDAAALLGHSGEGLVDLLTEDERRFVDDPIGLRPALSALAATRFFRPLPGSGTSVSEALSGPLSESARSAMSGSRAPLLAMCGLASMIRGSHGPELAAVAVPVLAGIGERDICGPVEAIRAALSKAPDVTAFVLPGSAHNHNVAARRVELWAELLAWVADLELRRDRL